MRARSKEIANGGAAGLLGIASVAAALGCSAQVEPGYRGEASATIHGSVLTGDGPAPSQADAAILWVDKNVPSDGMATARVSVGGEFPAAFTMEIFDPPPPAAPGESGLHFGVVAAVSPGSGDRIMSDEVLGVALEVGVVYFPESSEDPTTKVGNLAPILGVPATKGYHLYKIVLSEAMEREWTVCMNQGICMGSGDTPSALPTGLSLVYYNQNLESFERCLRYIPDAETCLMYSSPRNDAEAAENARCQELAEEKRTRVQGIGCGSNWGYAPNPEGFNLPVDIKLGASIWDSLDPHYRG